MVKDERSSQCYSWAHLLLSAAGWAGFTMNSWKVAEPYQESVWGPIVAVGMIVFCSAGIKYLVAGFAPQVAHRFGSKHTIVVCNVVGVAVALGQAGAATYFNPIPAYVIYTFVAIDSAFSAIGGPTSNSLAREINSARSKEYLETRRRAFGFLGGTIAFAVIVTVADLADQLNYDVAAIVSYITVAVCTGLAAVLHAKIEVRNSSLSDDVSVAREECDTAVPTVNFGLIWKQPLARFLFFMSLINSGFAQTYFLFPFFLLQAKDLGATDFLLTRFIALGLSCTAMFLIVGKRWYGGTFTRNIGLLVGIHMLECLSQFVWPLAGSVLVLYLVYPLGWLANEVAELGVGLKALQGEEEYGQKIFFPVMEKAEAVAKLICLFFAILSVWAGVSITIAVMAVTGALSYGLLLGLVDQRALIAKTKSPAQATGSL